MRSFLLVDARFGLISLALLAGAGPAAAALGQAPSVLPAAASSAVVPGAKMAAAVPNASSGPYGVHETLLETGTTVLEYATPAGVVFAVTWQGPVLPDLSVLLGNYFKIFKTQTDQARVSGQRGAPVRIATDGLVVSSSGRMRNFFGYAYAPTLVPAGVNIQDVLP